MFRGCLKTFYVRDFCNALLVWNLSVNTLSCLRSSSSRLQASPVTMVIELDSVDPSHTLFESFAQAQTCKETQQNFIELCRHLKVEPRDYKHFYSKLKDRLNYWKAKDLWQKIDKRGAHPDYEQGQACLQNKVP